MPDPLDELGAIADRADRLTRRLEAANRTRLRARSVSDPRGLVTLETDERNDLARVRVVTTWRNLSAEQLSEACVGAYRALGEAITEDWAEALDADDDGEDVTGTAPRRAAAHEETAISVPPDEVLTRAMERTAQQFEQLDRLERARAGRDPEPQAEDAVVGRSRDGEVTATFTPDGMLTGVAVGPGWTSGSAVRLGEAIADAVRDAVRQGEQLQAEQARDPYAELADQFGSAQAETRAMLRRSGLI